METSTSIFISFSNLSKKITFFILLLLGSFVAFAQNTSFKEMLNVTYSIQNVENIENPNLYIDALNNANMNNHRLKSDRNTINFDSGVKVTLYSAEESLLNGMTSINPSDFPNQIDDYTPPVFRVADNNYILELKQIKHSKVHKH